MPATVIQKHSNEMHANGDRVFERFFEEVIASPELTLLDDVLQDIDQKPQIHLPTPYPTAPHPYLHRLQSIQSGPPIGILKAHPYPMEPPTATSSTSSGGGISPTLTWSGGPSPIDPADSPIPLNNDADMDADGEEFKAPLFFSAPQAPAGPGKRTGGRGRNTSKPRSGGSPAQSRGSSRSHSLRSHSSSIGASDELTMSDLSLHHQHGAGTTSLRALLSTPPSPTGGLASPNVQLANSAPSRKKARTNSGSTRSSVDSVIDDLLAPMMDSARQAARLIPTGHRRNITSAALVPLNAPTQIRNYLTPSSTSKKEIPSAFVARRNKLKAKEAAVLKAATSDGGPVTAGRKRSRSQAQSDDGEGDDDGEDDGVDELQDDDTPMAGVSNAGTTPAPAKPSTTPTTANQIPQSPVSPIEELSQESSSLLSAIEAKRRQNTLAARRSRQRKLDYVRNLEELLAAMTKERNMWKSRAEKAEKVLGYRPDEDDEEDEAEAE